MAHITPVLIALLSSIFLMPLAVPMDAPPSGDIPTAEPPMESPYDSDGDGFMTPAEVEVAIAGRLEEFEFPEGYELDLDAINAKIRRLGESSLHENGAEYSWLGYAHMCAWGDVWLNAHETDDTETMDQAMDQLMTVTLGNPMYRYVTDYYRVIFEQAINGNTGPLEQLIQQQCRWDIFSITPTP